MTRTLKKNRQINIPLLRIGLWFLISEMRQYQKATHEGKFISDFRLKLLEDIGNAFKVYLGHDVEHLGWAITVLRALEEPITEIYQRDRKKTKHDGKEQLQEFKPLIAPFVKSTQLERTSRKFIIEPHEILVQGSPRELAHRKIVKVFGLPDERTLKKFENIFYDDMQPMYLDELRKILLVAFPDEAAVDKVIRILEATRSSEVSQQAG